MGGGERGRGGMLGGGREGRERERKRERERERERGHWTVWGGGGGGGRQESYLTILFSWSKDARAQGLHARNISLLQDCY